MKRYTDFDEIDRDLKFLRLKSRIDLEEVKIGFYYSKETLAEILSPVNFIAGTIVSIAKKAFILKIASKVISGFFGKNK